MGNLPTPSFNHDPHLSHLSQDSHFLFTPSPHARIHDRRLDLERYLNELKFLPIAFTSCGLNMVIPLSRVIRSTCSSKVTIESTLLFNGVDVTFKGVVDTISLEGIGRMTSREDPNSHIFLSSDIEILRSQILSFPE